MKRASPRRFVARTRPVATYFVLACALSWAGVLIVIGGPANLFVTPEQAAPLIPIAIPVMLVGPGVAGLLMIGVVDGRAGLRDYLASWRRWRVGTRWYALALLPAPVLATSTLLALWTASPSLAPAVATAPDAVGFIAPAVLGSLLVAVVEEIGWTGFALPALRRRHGVLASGVILGLLWGGWHGILALWGTSSPDGSLAPALVLPEVVFYILVLPVYRVLMVQAYERTASMPLTVLMHASLTATVPLILMPPAASGPALALWYLAFTAGLGGLLAAVLRRPASLRSSVGYPLG